MSEFWYTSPLHWNEECREYQIHMNSIHKRSQAYFDNTRKNIINILYNRITYKWKNILIDSGIHNRENELYIWIHLHHNEHNNVMQIKEIINDLDDVYKAEIAAHIIPSLVSTIHNLLHNSQYYFAQSLCQYQDKYGKDKTLEFLHIYFQYIKTSQYYDIIYDND